VNGAGPHLRGNPHTLIYNPACLQKVRSQPVRLL
jgi:hypothetical protein